MSSNIGVSIAKADKASFAQMVRPHKFKAIAFLFTQLEKGNYRQKTRVSRLLLHLQRVLDLLQKHPTTLLKVAGSTAIAHIDGIFLIAAIGCMYHLTYMDSKTFPIFFLFPQLFSISSCLLPDGDVNFISAFMIIQFYNFLVSLIFSLPLMDLIIIIHLDSLTSIIVVCLFFLKVWNVAECCMSPLIINE